VSTSTAAAGKAAGVDGVDTAELHAPFSHQELILREALGLSGDVTINPSGGALTANPMFSAGLNRIGEAATRIWAGQSDKALAHTTSGPVLQHNLVCTMEAEKGNS
jgi:acetyl-CoA acetyltransferase